MIQMGVHDTKRKRLGVRGCKPAPVREVLRLGGRVCDLPPEVLDRLAPKIKYADVKPARLVRAQRIVDESAQALRGES